MRRRISGILAILLAAASFFYGCGNDKIDTVMKQNEELQKKVAKLEEKVQNNSPAPASTSSSETSQNKTVIFSPADYIGVWVDTEYGKDVKSVNDIGTYGCVYIEIDNYDGTNIVGNISSIQAPPANRIAQVEFNTTVKNNQFGFNYDDDGWGNSGEVSIVLNNEEVSCNLTSSLEGNQGWELGSGSLKFKKLPDNFEASSNNDADNNNSNSADSTFTANSSDRSTLALKDALLGRWISDGDSEITYVDVNADTKKTDTVPVDEEYFFSSSEFTYSSHGIVENNYYDVDFSSGKTLGIKSSYYGSATVFLEFSDDNSYFTETVSELDIASGTGTIYKTKYRYVDSEPALD